MLHLLIRGCDRKFLVTAKTCSLLACFRPRSPYDIIFLLPSLHVLSRDGYLDSKGGRRTHRLYMMGRNQGLYTIRHFRSKHNPYQSSGYEIAPLVKIYWWHLNLENSFELFVNRLSTVCYVIRSVKVHVSTYKSYYTLCPFSFTYDIGHNILWESTHSSKVFNIQKTAIRIIMGRRSGESYRNLCKELKICHLNRSINFLRSYLWLITKATLRQI